MSRRFRFAMTLLLGFAFVVINLLLDVVYTLVDPRVRYE